MKITEVPLTREQGASLQQSIRRFIELSGRNVKTSGEEAEQKGLEAHIRNELFVHASELVGCWIAIINEYQPLVSAVSVLFRRVNDNLQPVPQEQVAAADAAAGIK